MKVNVSGNRKRNMNLLKLSLACFTCLFSHWAYGFLPSTTVLLPSTSVMPKPPCCQSQTQFATTLERQVRRQHFIVTESFWRRNELRRIRLLLCRAAQLTSAEQQANNQNNSLIETSEMREQIIDPTAINAANSTVTEITASASNATQQLQAALLEQLDQHFDYEGRILRGNINDNRCGYVCIIGAPNMGKSTLLNAILQEDLCICTSRPQTTRHAILGILSTNNTQVCFIDTPGIIETPAYKLQEGMMEAVISAFRDADVLLVVTDLFSTPIPNDTLFQKVQKVTKPIIVVINKIDLQSKVKDNKHQTKSTSKEIDDDGKSVIDSEAGMKKTISVEEAVARWRQLLPKALMIVPTSAQNGANDTGVVLLRRLLCGGPNVRDAIRDLGRPISGMFSSDNVTVNDSIWYDENIRSYLLPLSPPLYHTDTITDRTERFVASEIIRSVLFTTFQKELPYCCEVRINEFKEPIDNASLNINDKNKKIESMIRISADIVVERDSQKAIVIGTNGQQIKQVGMMAREKLQDFLQQPVRSRSTCTHTNFSLSMRIL
jgi:GTPase